MAEQLQSKRKSTSFTTGISVDPTMGEFEEHLRRQDEERRAAKAGVQSYGMTVNENRTSAQITMIPQRPREIDL